MDSPDTAEYFCEFCDRGPWYTLHSLRIHFSKMHRVELKMEPVKEKADAR